MSPTLRFSMKYQGVQNFVFAVRVRILGLSGNPIRRLALICVETFATKLTQER